MAYLTIFALVVALNLLPAFGPPTWALLVFASIHWHVAPAALVVEGVVAAGLGRWALATAIRKLRRYFPQRYLDNLQFAEERLSAKKTRLRVLFGLFVLSPLPSAQLFCAAGLLELPLAPLVGAFMLGRVVTYSLYIATATTVQRQLGGVFDSFFANPWSIALQLVLLAGLAALPLISWRQRGASRGG